MADRAVAIVGGGIGGAASALRAAQYHLPAVWIVGDRETRSRSRSAYVFNIDNMLGVHPDIVLGKVAGLLEATEPAAAARLAADHLHISTADLVENALARIRSDYADQVQIVEGAATGASHDGDLFRIRIGAKPAVAAASVVVATGVMDRQPIVHKRRGDRALDGIHWLFPYANHETLLYCIRCEGHLTAGRRIAVLGAGEAAAQVALMVRERYGSRVTVLTAGDRRSWRKESAALLDLEGIPVRDGRLTDVEGADRGATLRAFVLEDGSRVEADLAFVAMGLYRVYNYLPVELGASLEESDEPVERRHVLVDRNAETSVRGLFAVGDMARRLDETVMKQVYTAQEYAVRAIDTIDRRRRAARRRELLGRS